MPTGYAADIANGISFEKYALNCARAFGALIMMRDDPKDAPIPDKMPRSTYHIDALKAANNRIEELKNFTDKDKAIAAQLVFDSETKRYHERIQEYVDLEQKYRDMLAKVEAYTAPTKDHEGYKEFMKSQIEESIKWDCGTSYYTLPVLQSPDEWFSAELAKMAKDIEYHTKEQAASDKREDERDEWIRQLKLSLNVQ